MFIQFLLFRGVRAKNYIEQTELTFENCLLQYTFSTFLFSKKCQKLSYSYYSELRSQQKNTLRQNKAKVRFFYFWKITFRDGRKKSLRRNLHFFRCEKKFFLVNHHEIFFFLKFFFFLKITSLHPIWKACQEKFGKKMSFCFDLL